VKRDSQHKTKQKDILYHILLVAFAGVFLFAGFRLFMIYYNYGKAGNEYNSLKNVYITKEKPDQTQNKSAAGANSTSVNSYPDWKVDFTSLEKINGEIVGWVYMQACDISYPIVRATDNTYYLTHTFEKKVNSSGAIFMDSENKPDFTDLNTFVYGHNMKNGSMFGKMKKLYKEKDLRKENPFFYIFLPNHKVIQYEIFSYYITTDDSDSYVKSKTEKEYDEYVKRVEKKSLERIQTDMSGHSPIVTLSTCSGASGGDQRFLVHGVQTGYSKW